LGDAHCHEGKTCGTGQRTQYQQKYVHTPVPCPDQTAAATNNAILAASSTTRKFFNLPFACNVLAARRFLTFAAARQALESSVTLAQVW
jgi:hypothetical protein